MQDEEPMYPPYSSQPPFVPVKDMGASVEFPQSPQGTESPKPANSDEESEQQRRDIRRLIMGIITLFLVAGTLLWLIFGSTSEQKPMPPADDFQNTGQIISAEKGGIIEGSDGATLYIPAGAIARDTVFKIERVREGRVTDVYHLSPDGFPFLNTVVVGIPYHKEGLKKGEEPEDIRFEWWEEDGRPHIILDSYVNREQGKIYGLLMRF